MISLAKTINGAIDPLRMLAEKVGAPLFDLAARLFVANAFFMSGILRFKDFLNGTFDSQVFLFQFEHPVPGIPPEIAAYMAMTGEILLPVLLVLGLFGRFAAAGILIMTAIIEFTYIHAPEHILWAVLATSLFIKRPGTLSIDYFLVKFLRKDG